VESLSRNTHASETELVIGLDYPAKESHWEGYRQIVAYIDTITGFKKVTVFKRTENWGAVKNLRDLYDYALARYDAVIGTEDDNEFSPCFLDFMNKALEKYRDEPKVVSVCGYGCYLYYGLTDNNVIFGPDGGAWGLGIWKKEYMINRSVPYSYYRNLYHSFSSSWRLLKASPASYLMLRSMIKKNEIWGDIMRSTRSRFNGTYQVTPSLSLVRNWGSDGTGLHGSADYQHVFENQEISKETTFNLEDYPIETVPALSRAMFFQNMGNTRWRILKSMVKASLYFIYDRFVKL
jgi:hypothetical protein